MNKLKTGGMFMKKSCKIAVLPGDGIGPELMQQEILYLKKR